MTNRGPAGLLSKKTQSQRMKTEKVSTDERIKLWFDKKVLNVQNKLSFIQTFHVLFASIWILHDFSTGALLADVGQVVVAGNVVPLPVLMGNGHHTVLPTSKEVVWLALPPVLINLHSSKTVGSNVSATSVSDLWILWNECLLLHCTFHFTNSDTIAKT